MMIFIETSKGVYKKIWGRTIHEATITKCEIFFFFQRLTICELFVKGCEWGLVLITIKGV